jgi:hypothetical protein
MSEGDKAPGRFHLTELDESVRDFQEMYPGWQFWYVLNSVSRTVTWCARPWPLINTDALSLAGDIAAAHAEAAEKWPALASLPDYETRTRQPGKAGQEQLWVTPSSISRRATGYLSRSPQRQMAAETACSSRSPAGLRLPT